MNSNVVVNRDLLNRILVEEGMGYYRAKRIIIDFRHSRYRSWRDKFYHFLLHGDPFLTKVAGMWWEGREIAYIYTDRHKSLKATSETLAHELGHALDRATPSSYSQRKIWMIWVLYLALVVATAIRMFGGYIQINGIDGWPSLAILAVKALGWLIIADVLAFFVWLLIDSLFYRNIPEEESAREWTERLTSREDWKQVLSLKTDSSPGS